MTLQPTQLAQFLIRKFVQVSKDLTDVMHNTVFFTFVMK